MEVTDEAEQEAIEALLLETRADAGRFAAGMRLQHRAALGTGAGGSHHHHHPGWRLPIKPAAPPSPSGVF
eukprot:scaffold13043_cov118-Isochrysis_galbana.AAC.1